MRAIHDVLVNYSGGLWVMTCGCGSSEDQKTQRCARKCYDALCRVAKLMYAWGWTCNHPRHTEPPLPSAQILLKQLCFHPCLVVLILLGSRGRVTRCYLSATVLTICSHLNSSTELTSIREQNIKWKTKYGKWRIFLFSIIYSLSWYRLKTQGQDTIKLPRGWHNWTGITPLARDHPEETSATCSVW